MKSQLKIGDDILSKILFPLIIVLFLFFIFYLIHKVLIGDIAFWYDPARDMLSAWGNLSKPTLIGPPSGIPGVFYGPYWIWLLSFGMLFSRDPRVIVFITATLPYLVVFPAVLVFSDIFERKVAFLLWILFLLGYSTYAISLWNPYPAPFLLLFFVLMLERMRFNTWSVRDHLQAGICGFSLGLLLNFHLSLGIGICLGVLFYFLFRFLNGIRKNEKKLFFTFHFGIQKLFFALGLLVAFGPYVVFEIRHQFTQTKVLLNTFFHYGGTITLHGLTKPQILGSFFSPAGQLLHLPELIGVIVFIASGLFLLYQNKKRTLLFSSGETRLLSLLLCLSSGILFIYLTAKNPIWSYHFIAVEILFLLFIGFLMQKIPVFRLLITLWIFVLLVQFAVSFPRSIKTNPRKISGDLVAEIAVTKRIGNDAGQSGYTVFSYSPSIYMYEYSYLFRWLENKNFSYDPGMIRRQGSVYLIYPPSAKKNLVTDFIHDRTPVNEYKTIQMWTMADGSIIIKREEIK